MENQENLKYKSPEQAAESVAQSFKECWKQFIREKITQGVSPEDLRDPEKLGSPTGDEYNQLTTAFGKLIGYGKSMDDVVEEAIAEVLK
ncbi:hypothetical protein KW797_01060 [Candidatus Parcubacteria bacterium]|nr:hypothetical protein [Candidatus Parcubacteria bacterium]